MKKESSALSKIYNLKFEICNFLSRGERGGFTLIEVLVAIMILSISFVIIMQLFAGGLRAARTSCDYTRAIVLAKAKMEELSESPVNESGAFEEGFKWESEVETHKELEEMPVNLMKIKVKVTWDDGFKKSKSVELVSLKVVSDEQNL